MYYFPTSTTTTSSRDMAGKTKKKRSSLLAASQSSSPSPSSSHVKAKAVPRLSTDPQSVAARERRHRISDRFKILQSLVPGGSKMDTVSMLEEAIHYVKFLKAQVWLHQSMIMVNDGRTVVLDAPDHGGSAANVAWEDQVLEPQAVVSMPDEQSWTFQNLETTSFDQCSAYGKY